jgi:cysteinyl-tRNA synthetase
MYHCGPTVYDTPHLGNYRTFIMDDLLRRTFEYNGYEVIQVMNITDVDDKTIKRSHEEKVDLKTITKKYESLFLQGLGSLNVLTPKQIVRATENIPEMIELIDTLLKKNVAYKAEDGIYVSIDKVKNYGKLAGLNIDSSTHERIANDEYDKDNPRDFAIWKFANDISWETPFGAGRPGWHIECSAMSMKVLGYTIDIHTGGIDLVFPHHTNEIAQSESATGKQFVHYWLHGGFMNIDSEKMAKSAGNFIKLEDLDHNSISPLAFRYWLLTAHYRSPINFTYEAVQGAQNALVKLMATVGAYPDGGEVISDYKDRFMKFVNDDIDLPQAVALIWDLIKDKDYKPEDKKVTILDFDKVLGLKLDTLPKIDDVEIPEEIQILVEEREHARKDKDWVKADALRDEITARGFTIEDTTTGIKIRPLHP